MRISFHGAAGQVTGSCHLLECDGARVLIDCGMFQGSRAEVEESDDLFGFDPREIDALLLTHAHLDHCGRLPMLVRSGFRGEIIATAATRELARLVLLDAAHIQEEDARRQGRRRMRQGKKPLPPLFCIPDALRAVDAFGRSAHYEEPVELPGGMTVRFIEAGHILGSASLVIDAPDGAESRRIVFSGDIGSAGRPVLPSPTLPPEADYVVMETTYGDRRHRDFDASRAELIDAIRRALARGGNVIIPTFALERAQELLFVLSEAVDRKELPRHLPVFLDFPMAVSATEIFARYPEAFRPDFRDAITSGRDPFGLPGLRFTRDVEDSIAINRIRGGAVIMAGSGMCTGGRVLHHLKHNLWRSECSVVIVGFAAKGTLARRIVDGARTVKLYGETVAVKAKVHTINGFSAHADRDELQAWHEATGRPKTTFLVHGDQDGGMEAFRQRLESRGFNIRCPEPHEEFDLE